MHRKIIRLWLVLLVSMLSVCANASDSDRYQDSDMGSMDWRDDRDFEFANRGFIATRSSPVIRSPQGHLVYDLNESVFLEDADIDTIHPSLLRQAKLLRRSGLFEVAEGVYQVRGFDITNITFIRGETGWIVVDPGLAPSSTRAAYALVTEHLGNRPVSGIIYTHSHVDHFGGVAGLINQEDAARLGIPVLAPEGFMEAVLDEFLINGVATHRRTEYAGIGIERGPLGTVSAGIADGAGKELWSLIPPNALVTDDTQERVVDGVDIIFQLTPGTEAPAEMNLYLPQFRVLHMAENANVSLHNVLSPRGVVVRDAKSWADQLSLSIHRFADDSDAVVISHGWPRFGSEEIREYLSKHRDAYKFLHDQTVRLMNEGLVPDEIAIRLRLPDSLTSEWYNRGYYGDLSFNARAVYQRYLGWY
jgi:alkyl sulfatase BDS1-like metallo-beta-lactamase superfamily hydrolase